MPNIERLPPDSSERWRALLGRKISVRYALANDPDHPFSEAIGVISGVSEGADPTITIMGRTGMVTEVAASSVLVGKVFP